MLEQVDRHVLGACVNRRGSSSLLSRTKKQSVRQDGLFFYKKRRLELPRALGKVPAEKQHAAYLIVPYRKLLHLIDFGKKTSAQ